MTTRASRSPVTFADYLLPTVAEIPAIECLVTEDAPSPRNPLGIKGGGEGGINGVGAAIGERGRRGHRHAGRDRPHADYAGEGSRPPARQSFATFTMRSIQ